MMCLSEGVDEAGYRGIDPVLIGKDGQDHGLAQTLVGKGKNHRLEGRGHGGSPVVSVMHTSGMCMVEAAVMSAPDSKGVWQNQTSFASVGRVLPP